MNKKGFSLVELMGVIVILMVIALLATNGYRFVRQKMKQTSFDNKVSYIETKAVEYANKTGNLHTNVDQLVKEGLLLADDEEGHVINPINGEYMNCKVVYITKEVNDLYGNYVDDKEKEICDFEGLKNENMFLELKAFSMNENEEKGEEIEESAWVRTNVYLEAVITDPKIDKNEVIGIKWRSNVDEIQTNAYGYKVEAEQIIHSTYFVEMRLRNGTIYQASKEVKIDKQRPIIYDSEISIEKEHEWANRKNVTIKATDGNGSGIYGYSIGKNNDCVHANYIEEEDNIFQQAISEEGTYYICVKDRAGNVSEDVSTKTFTVEKIDNVPPTCVFSGESTSWTTSNRTISLGCSDEGGSGCVLEEGQGSISKTYSTNTKTDIFNYVISDQAGNTTDCSKICNETGECSDRVINVYVDKCTATSPSYGGWSGCSASCGGGHQSRSIYYYSTFGSGFLCSSSTQTSSCNTHSCPKPPSGGDGGGSGDSGGGCDNPTLVWCGGTGGPGIDAGHELCVSCG